MSSSGLFLNDDVDNLRPVKSYDRRPRHKTRTDRYKPKQKQAVGRRKTKKREGREEGRVEVASASKTASRSRRRQRRGKSQSLERGFSSTKATSSQRLTLRPKRQGGVFAQGRASSPLLRRGVPDLAFAEAEFLKGGRKDRREVLVVKKGECEEEDVEERKQVWEKKRKGASLYNLQADVLDSADNTSRRFYPANKAGLDNVAARTNIRHDSDDHNTLGVYSRFQASHGPVSGLSARKGQDIPANKRATVPQDIEKARQLRPESPSVSRSTSPARGVFPSNLNQIERAKFEGAPQFEPQPPVRISERLHLSRRFQGSLPASYDLFLDQQTKNTPETAVAEAIYKGDVLLNRGSRTRQSQSHPEVGSPQFGADFPRANVDELLDFLEEGGTCRVSRERESVGGEDGLNEITEQEFVLDGSGREAFGADSDVHKTTHLSPTSRAYQPSLFAHGRESSRVLGQYSEIEFPAFMTEFLPQDRGDEQVGEVQQYWIEASDAAGDEMPTSMQTPTSFETSPVFGLAAEYGRGLRQPDKQSFEVSGGMDVPVNFWKPNFIY